MSILFLTRPQPPEVFLAKMAELAPDIESFGAIEACDPGAVEAVVCYRLPRGIAAKLPNLRMVCATSAGVDKILGVEGLPAGLPVVRIVDAAQNRQIAQFVAMSVLNHVRQRALFARQQAERVWTRHPIAAPDAAVVGVLGLGAAGQVTATTLLGLGFRVAGWSRSPRAFAGIETFHGPAGLDACLARSDILVCLLPLTDGTRGLLDRRTLAKLPKGAYLVNVARGAHVVEPDLLALIDEGHLAGAALDVQATEPLPPDSPLWTHPALVITPHIASQPTVDSVTRQVIASVRRMRGGQPLENLVDLARGY